MIFPNIAEFEVGDSQLAQYTISQLHDKINRAIEYIEKKLIPYGNEWHWDDGKIGYMVEEELLRILKGGE